MSDGQATQDQLDTNAELLTNVMYELAQSRMTVNETTQRELLKRFSTSGRERNINEECGYIDTTEVSPNDLYNAYKRDPIARRVIEIWPKECWKKKPTVYDNEDTEVNSKFEKRFEEVCRGLTDKSWSASTTAYEKFWAIVEQADILSGVGSFGIIVLGFDDGKDLKEPVAGFEESSSALDPETFTTNAEGGSVNLLYMQPYAQKNVEITTWDEDETSRRYQMPTMYRITKEDEDHVEKSPNASNSTVEIHWSRVVHIVDDPQESDVYSDPRLLVVLNRLHDMNKLYGGSAEMYWQGALPGLKFEPVDKDVKIDNDVIKAIKSNVKDYVNKLKRFLASDKMRIDTLAPTVSDPSKQIEVQIESICIVEGIPKRIFVGSERGELASSQDKTSFDDRVEARRTSTINPRMITPLIDRLIAAGVLPEPESDGFKIEWPSLREKDDLEAAEIAHKVTEVLVKYIAGGVNDIITPIDFLVDFLNVEKERAEQYIENALEAQEDEDNPLNDTGEEDDEAQEVPNPEEAEEEESEEETPDQSGVPTANEGELTTNRLSKRKGGWVVLSKQGKVLGGPYDTKEKARKRLRQVEHFKDNK